jgi:hypothetical protein
MKPVTIETLIGSDRLATWEEVFCAMLSPLNTPLNSRGFAITPLRWIPTSGLTLAALPKTNCGWR